MWRKVCSPFWREGSFWCLLDVHGASCDSPWHLHPQHFSKERRKLVTWELGRKGHMNLPFSGMQSSDALICGHTAPCPSSIMWFVVSGPELKSTSQLTSDPVLLLAGKNVPDAYTHFWWTKGFTGPERRLGSQGDDLPFYSCVLIHSSHLVSNQ